MKVPSNANYEKTLIIGWGVTGKATGAAMKVNDYVDLGEKADLKEFENIILCVSTPTKRGKQDLSAIEEWLVKIKKESPDALVVIRSTMLPGTTKKLSDKYGLDICHVPEFLTESTAFEDAKRPELLVIGADDPLVRDKAWSLFVGKFDYNKRILCDSVTAELIKYSMNSFFALKVIYANQLWDICDKTGADYAHIRYALESHKWGSQNGWDVWHGGFRGYDGKCLPKDVKALIGKFDLPLLKTMDSVNNELLKEK